MEILDKIPLTKKGIDEILLDEETGLIYLFFAKENCVMVIDSNSNKIIKEIKVEVERPSSMALNPKSNRLFVFSSSAGFRKKREPSISVIDTVSNMKIDTIEYQGEKMYPRAFKANPETNRLYLSNESKINVINSENYSLEKSIEVKDVQALEIDKRKNLLYFGSDNPFSVLVYDGTNHEFVKKIPVKGWNHTISDIILNPYRNLLYVWKIHSPEGGSGTFSLEIIDVEKNSSLNNKGFGSTDDFTINPSSNTVYMRNSGSNKVFKFDELAQDIIEDIELSKKSFWRRMVSSSYEKIIVEPKTSKIFTTDENQLLVIQD